MISSWLIVPLQAAGSAWTVQFGPWSLPPQAWLPATALIGAMALRTRARSFRLHGRKRSQDSDAA